MPKPKVSKVVPIRVELSMEEQSTDYLRELLISIYKGAELILRFQESRNGNKAVPIRPEPTMEQQLAASIQTSTELSLRFLETLT